MGRSWVGVDVGGRRKGFHVAVVDDGLHVTLGRARTADACVDLLIAARPSLVGIDSPCAWAEPGELSRACERAFAATGLCGIRFTPNEKAARARTDRYLEWVWLGLELWDALAEADVPAVECFPTASWSAWLGARRSRSRATWTTEGIARLRATGVGGLEEVRDQDQRDAVAAALTARQTAVAPDAVVRFGALVVPEAGSIDRALGRA